MNTLPEHLTAVHLLLQEFGWEAKYYHQSHASLAGWSWKRPGCAVEIWTCEKPLWERDDVPPYDYKASKPALCTEYRQLPDGQKRREVHFTLTGLRGRLEEVAQK
jgi:hypothetical protein